MTTTTTTYESRWGQQHADVLANITVVVAAEQ